MALAICAAAALLSLWLRAGLPLLAIGGAALDDALFLKLAQSLLAGEWLGPYDHVTLAKGMFYPLFAAVSFSANLPLKIAEHLVYLAVSGWLAAFAARQSGRRSLGVVLFVALALNPIMWLPFMARVVREGLYVSLSLLVLGLFAAALFETRAQVAPRRRIAIAGLAGLALGCFWLTREEGPWIVPALAVLLFARALLEWRQPAPAGQLHWARKPLPSLALTVLLPLFSVFLLTVGGVKAANKYHYGVFETNEFHSRSFQRGYGALSRIRPAQWQRHVVFPRDARQQAYAHSGAARELAPFFEGTDGERWRAIGCTQVTQATCTEIHSGWFMWALREAVAQAGHYRSASQALAFYDRMADEIDAACDAGKIDCLGARATMAPPFRTHYVRDMLAPTWQLAQFVFQMGGATAGAWDPSSGTPAEIDFFQRMTGGWPAPGLHVAGWAAAREPIEEVALYNVAGHVASRPSGFLPATDVEKLWPGLHAVRFAIPSHCAPADCQLRVRTRTSSFDLPLRRGFVLQEPAARVHLDELASQGLAGVAGARRAFQERVMGAIRGLYASTFPYLTLLALAGTLWALARPAIRRSESLWIALAAACLAAVLSRIALLAYLDVTSIPSSNGSYATPASALLVVFVVLGLWLGWQSLRRQETPQRSTAA